jgi:hypothetical protein
VHDISVHDLQLTRVLKGRLNESNSIVFPFWRSGGSLANVALVNLNCTECGSYFARGEGGDGSTGTSEKWRLQNVSVTFYGDETLQSNSAVSVAKFWGQVTGVEILDSTFNANPVAWNAGNVSYAIAGPYLYDCVQSATIRNNDFADFKVALALGAGEGFCTTRRVDNIVFDANDVHSSFDWSYNQWVQIHSGPSTTLNVATVSLTNNIFVQGDVTPGSNTTFLWSYAGNNGGAQTGSITLAGNTFYGPSTAATWVIGDNGWVTPPSYPQQNYVIKDNIIAGLGAGSLNISTSYAPSNWTVDHNVYHNDPTGARFRWNNGSTTAFAAWQTNSGGDTHSTASCPPAFVAAPNDLHLQSTDTCARDTGTNIGAITTVDYDGDTRPSGGWDIGADEYVSALPAVLHEAEPWP